MAVEHLQSVLTAEVEAAVLNGLDGVPKVTAFQLVDHQVDHLNALAMMDVPKDLVVAHHLVRWTLNCQH